MANRKDEQMAACFKALGHPVRLQIIRQLEKTGACFGGDIAEGLPVAASTTSQHLKMLREAGIISMTHDSQRRCYSLRRQVFSEIRRWLARYQVH